MANGSGSFRQSANGVKLAGEESKDRMYEPKHTKKLVRVLTVVAYIFSVSLAAIMLSVYYVFLWNPRDHHPVPAPKNVSAAAPAPDCPPPPPKVRGPTGMQEPAGNVVPQSRGSLPPTTETPIETTPTT